MLRDEPMAGSADRAAHSCGHLKSSEGPRMTSAEEVKRLQIQGARPVNPT